MKNFISHLVAFGFLMFPSFFPMTNLMAQGSLTPPGAPAPTMKTLAQIEPRTPIASTGSPQTLSQSGSYYLTGDLTVSSGSVIVITASNVKLDLCGHFITSTDPNGGSYGIQLNGPLTNITIVNGLITSGVTNNGTTAYGGPGFSFGITSGSSSVYNTRVKNVQVYGCRLHGIMLSTNTATLVKDCEVSDVGAAGIQADMVLDCSVNAGGTISNAGIAANTASNCRSFSYGGPGIQANHIADNCYGASFGSYGIIAGVVNSSQGTSSLQVGINSTVVAASNGVSSSTDGIYTFVGMNSYASTTATGSFAFYAQYLATDCAGFGPNGIYGFESLVSCWGTTEGGGHLYNTP